MHYARLIIAVSAQPKFRVQDEIHRNQAAKDKVGDRTRLESEKWWGSSPSLWSLLDVLLGYTRKDPLILQCSVEDIPVVFVTWTCLRQTCGGAGSVTFREEQSQNDLGPFLGGEKKNTMQGCYVRVKYFNISRGLVYLGVNGVHLVGHGNVNNGSIMAFSRGRSIGIEI